MRRVGKAPPGHKLHTQIDAVETWLTTLEARRQGASAWSPRRALDAQMVYLAALESAAVALWMEERDIATLAAQGAVEQAMRRFVVKKEWHVRARVFLSFMGIGAYDVARPTWDIDAQNDAIAAMWDCAREIRWRVSVLRSDWIRAQRAKRSLWDRTGGFPDTLLTWFDKARVTHGGRLQLDGAALPGTHAADLLEEINGHFGALAGDMVIPHAPEALRFAQSYLTRAETRRDLAVGALSTSTAPSEPSAEKKVQLLDAFREHTEAGNPIAPLLGFVDAVQIYGLSSTRIVREYDPLSDATTLIIPPLPRLALEFLGTARDGDGWRAHAERAAMTLGWEDAETEPGRSASDRRAREAKGAALRAMKPSELLRRVGKFQQGGRSLAKIAADHAMPKEDLEALVAKAQRRKRDAERKRTNRRTASTPHRGHAADIARCPRSETH